MKTPKNVFDRIRHLWSVWMEEDKKDADVIRFLEKALYLHTLGNEIEFKHIVRWLDSIFFAPVYAVYKKIGERDLILFDKFLFQKNISVVRHGIVENQTSGKSRKQSDIIKMIEERFVNLTRKIEWTETLATPGELVLNTGRGYSFPLIKREKIWGIFYIGPYAEIPNYFRNRTSLFSELIAGWLEAMESKDILMQKYHEQNVFREIRKLGSFVINTDQLLEFFLKYLMKATNTTFALLGELRHSRVESVYSIHFREEWTSLFLGPVEKTVLIFDQALGMIYQEESGRVLEAGIHSHFIFPILHSGKMAFLLIGSDQKDFQFRPNAIKTIQQFCNLLGIILQTRDSVDEQLKHLLEMYYSMIKIYELRYEKTAYHTERVIQFTRWLCEWLNVDPLLKLELESAARLHDVGYIIALEMKEELGIDSEYEHPLLGKYLLDNLPVSDIMKNAIYMHEEWYDGNGYPRGIQGENIPIEARVISLAERMAEFVDDNVQNETGMEQLKLIEFLEERKGKQLFPDLVEVVNSHLKNLTWDEIKKVGIL